MSTSENLPPKKKKLKKWQIALIVFFVFPIIVALFVGGSSTTTPDPTPTPEVSEEPEIPLNYSAEITRWEPLNPASGTAVFTIRNTGEASFIPTSCSVRVQDESNTYKGSDYVYGSFNEIKPGAKFMGKIIFKRF
jgi:hypothetical protein